MESKGFPLFDRFPALAALPRVSLGVFPSPVERLTLDDGRTLWLKRDDRNALVAAGNKVRSLEFLLAGVRPGEAVLTAGGEGSTHVYATAVHAERLGASTDAYRWRQEMHPVADAVARQAAWRCLTVVSARSPVGAVVGMAWRRLRWRVAGTAHHYVPIGGASALGVLGHVNAGLELATQVLAGDLPEPTHVVVPLGSGGTAAGLALGLGAAGMGTAVVAARVTPRLVANGWRINRLIARARALIRSHCGADVPLPAAPVVVDHAVYGGAYGRTLPAAVEAAARIERATSGGGGGRPPIVLDPTYAGKAAAAALAWCTLGDPNTRRAESTGRRVLLWVTFDGRGLAEPSGRSDRERRRDS